MEGEKCFENYFDVQKILKINNYWKDKSKRNFSSISIRKKNEKKKGQNDLHGTRTWNPEII